MPLSTNAPMLSVPMLKPGLIEAFGRRIQQWLDFPFVWVEGASFDFATHGSFAAQLAPGQVIVDSTTAISDQTASPDNLRKFGFDLYATRYRIAYYWQDRLTVPNDLRTTEGVIAERQIIYAYHKRLAETVLPGMLDANMLVGGSGSATSFSLADLDEAYFKIRDNDGRPTAILSSEMTLRRYIQACRDYGYEAPTELSSWADPIYGRVRAPRISLHGTPWYINDWVYEGEGAPQVYFMVMGDQENAGPGHGLVGILPSDRRSDPFVRRVSTPDAQFVNVDLVFPAGFALGSLGALSAYQFAP